MYISVLYFVCFVISKSTFSKTYNNYTLFRTTPLNDNQITFLETLIHNYDINIWKDIGGLNTPFDFIVHTDEQPDLLLDAKAVGLKLEARIPDVQKAFDRQTVKTYVKRRMSTMDWQNYYRLDDIYNWLQDLKQSYPGEVTLESVGKSHENRDIMSVKVVLKGSTPSSKVIVEGGIHAREWVGPVFVTYLIYIILNAPNSSVKNVKDMALSYEWYFVPVLNPDGYEYSHTEDRLWRKNRNSIPVDLNRNFGVGVEIGFDTNDNSGYNSESYPGPRAFSEKETIAMAEFVRSKSSNLKYYLAFHSYGQFMILPYGYTQKHLDNYDETFQMCSEASKKIAERYNTRFKVGNPAETVGYTAGGASSCWVKKTFEVPYVITFELRDEGSEGFTLPPSKILPTCRETLDGVVYLLRPKSQISSNAEQLLKISNQIMIVFNLLLFIKIHFS